LRSLVLQQSTRAQACPPPASLVAGSYQSDPVRGVGEFVVVTYVAECDAPGRPRRTINGSAAISSMGGACSGHNLVAPTTVATNPMMTTIANLSAGSCDVGSGRNKLSFVSGYVVGLEASDAVTAELRFSNGAVESSPIHNGRIVVVALQAGSVCTVRALDAAGVPLAEIGPLGMPGTCQ
jgi:hypothetical protein